MGLFHGVGQEFAVVTLLPLNPQTLPQLDLIEDGVTLDHSTVLEFELGNPIDQYGLVAGSPLADHQRPLGFVNVGDLTTDQGLSPGG